MTNNADAILYAPIVEEKLPLGEIIEVRFESVNGKVLVETNANGAVTKIHMPMPTTAGTAAYAAPSWTSTFANAAPWAWMMPITVNAGRKR